jgi:hypothetical protein
VQIGNEGGSFAGNPKKNIGALSAVVEVAPFETCEA